MSPQCPFHNEDGDRRAPAVRLTDETIEHIEKRITAAVKTAWDDTMANESVLRQFADRLRANFLDSLAREATEVAKSGILSMLRLVIMSLLWCSIAYILFGVSGMTAAFKAVFFR